MIGIYVFGVLVIAGMAALVVYKIRSSRSESRKWDKLEAERSLDK
jgi:hypothetical protein